MKTPSTEAGSLRAALDALRQIAAFRPLTFAECSDAEAIIGIAERAVAALSAASPLPAHRFKTKEGVVYRVMDEPVYEAQESAGGAVQRPVDAASDQGDGLDDFETVRLMLEQTRKYGLTVEVVTFYGNARANGDDAVTAAAHALYEWDL